MPYKSAIAIISRPGLFSSKQVLDAACFITATEYPPGSFNHLHDDYKKKAVDVAKRVLTGEQRTLRLNGGIRTLGTV